MSGGQFTPALNDGTLLTDEVARDGARQATCSESCGYRIRKTVQEEEGDDGQRFGLPR